MGRWGLVLVALVACGKSEEPAARCMLSSDCDEGQVCINSLCWVPSDDASAPPPPEDAGSPAVDSGPEPEGDASLPDSGDASVITDGGEFTEMDTNPCVAEEESCDDTDNDCDGAVDEGVWDCDTCTGDDCVAPRYPGVCVLEGDIGVDDVIDRRWTYDYDEMRLRQQDYDSDLDGVMNSRVEFLYDAGGRRVGDIRYDANLVITGRAQYFYDSNGRTDRIEYDLDNNGATDQITRYLYSSGRLAQQEIDRMADGSTDDVWSYFYDDTDVLVRADRRRGGNVDYQQHYYYDARGNTDYLDLDTDNDGVINERRLYDYSCWPW